MRIFINPVYTSLDIYSDSLYIIGRIFGNVVSERADVEVDMAVPSGARRFDIDRDKVRENLGAVNPVFCPMDMFYRTQQCEIPDRVVDRYNFNDGTHQVDFIIEMSSRRASVLWDALTRVRHVNEEKYNFIFVWDLLVRSKMYGKEFSDLTRASIIRQGIGHLNHASVYESPIARKCVVDPMRSVLAPTKIRDLTNENETIPLGFEWSSVQEAIIDDESEKRDKTTIYYGGRISNSKGVDETIEAFNTNFCMGMDIEMFMTVAGTAMNKAQVKETKLSSVKDILDGVKMEVGLGWMEALREMSRCHISVINSRFELFCMSCWEQMSAGLIVLIREEEWTKGLVPEDYPFMFSDKDELVKLMNRVIKNYDECKEKMEEYQEWVVDEYAASKTMWETYKFFRSEVESIREEYRFGTSLLKEVVEENDVFQEGKTFNDVMLELKRIMKKRLDDMTVSQLFASENGRAWSYKDIYEVIRQKGFRVEDSVLIEE